MMGNGGERPGAPDEPGGRILQPQQAKGLVGAKHLAIGGGNVAVLLGDGTLRMWGHNGYDESGIGSANAYEMRPVKTALTNVAAVYLGNMRSYAVRTDGTFWIWGFPFTPGSGILAKTWKVRTRLDCRELRHLRLIAPPRCPHDVVGDPQRSRCLHGAGIHGQAIYIDPVAEMVIARFGSHPLGADVNLDSTSLPAYHALAQHLMR